MSRDLSTLNAAQSQATSLTPIAFVKLQFDGANLCLHTGVGTITWGGDTYTGAGTLGGIDPVSEDVQLSSSPLKLTLSGIPSTLLGAVLNEQYQGRPGTVYIGFLDATTQQLVDTPDIAYGGFMDTVAITQGATATISLQLDNELAAWSNPVIRRYNDADQQALFPGDTGFEFIEQMVNQPITWGTPS